MKIAFIHNYYIHYRIPFFELFSEKYRTVFFFYAVQSYVENISSKITYKIPFNIKLANFTIPILLPFYLIRKRFDLFIAGDAANVSTVEAYIISKILKKPFILWEERWFIQDGISNLMWPFIRFVSSHARALIVPGTKSKEFFLEIGVPSNKIFIAPNASYIQTSASRDVEIKETRRRLGLFGKIVILYFGRVTKIKGISNLLKAFNKLCGNRDNLYLILAGDIDSRYKKELDWLSKDLILSNLKITGRVSMIDRERYFGLADVVVVPSVAEVWGLAINEALVAGKPVISTKTTGGAYDLIQNNVNGFIVSPDKVEELIDSLNKLFENPNLMREFGKNSRKIAEQGYTYSHMMSGFTNAIETIHNTQPFI